MRSEFLSAQAAGAKKLDAAQARHRRLRAQADEALERACARHRIAVAQAAAVEAQAWRDLLDIRGMTVITASQLTGTPQAEIRRWAVARVPRPAATVEAEASA